MLYWSIILFQICFRHKYCKCYMNPSMRSCFPVICAIFLPSGARSTEYFFSGSNPATVTVLDFSFEPCLKTRLSLHFWLQYLSWTIHPRLLPQVRQARKILSEGHIVILILHFNHPVSHFFILTFFNCQFTRITQYNRKSSINDLRSNSKFLLSKGGFLSQVNQQVKPVSATMQAVSSSGLRLGMVPLYLRASFLLHVLQMRNPATGAYCCFTSWSETSLSTSKNFEFDLKSLIGTLPIVLGDPRKLAVEERSVIRNGLTGWLKCRISMTIWPSDRIFRLWRTCGRSLGWMVQDNTEARNGGIIVFRHGSKEKSRTVTVAGLDPEKNIRYFWLLMVKILHKWQESSFSWKDSM